MTHGSQMRLQKLFYIFFGLGASEKSFLEDQKPIFSMRSSNGLSLPKYVGLNYFSLLCFENTIISWQSIFWCNCLVPTNFSGDETAARDL